MNQYLSDILLNPWMEEKNKKGQLSSIDLRDRTLLQVERIMLNIKVVIDFPITILYS